MTAPFDPLGTIEIVDHADPRLDTDAMDIEKYKETYDPALIRDKDSSKPALRFLFKPLDFNFFNRHLTNQPSSQLMDLSIRAGIVAVKLPDGSVRTPTTKPSDFAQPVATPAWFAEIGKLAGFNALANVTSGVLHLTRLPEASLPTSPSYPG